MSIFYCIVGILSLGTAIFGGVWLFQGLHSVIRWKVISGFLLIFTGSTLFSTCMGELDKINLLNPESNVYEEYETRQEMNRDNLGSMTIISIEQLNDSIYDVKYKKQ